MTARTTVLLDWLLPVVLLVGLTIPFWTTSLDMGIEARFYSSAAGWEQGGAEPWHALKHYGVIPAWIVGIAALVVFVSSFWNSRARTWRRPALFLVLALAIGPGVIVNDVFKENWGRPRPLDVTELGGDRAYVEPWVKSPKEMGGSFVSGHAAMGFYLLVPYFLMRRRSRTKAVAVLMLGLGYGFLVGVARMVQGAHFASDVLWAFGFTYLTALALFYAMGLHRASSAADQARAPAAGRAPSP
ncbi:MAG: phosphatase PAP2 family protein [Candidatus Krumholzibacteria bacterium]|nr:phosphatase PAP2 family protein [Candidatus Krumholzibacteria bacterium]MDH4336144.1 phosphatase PAP2 family protein [Candidatus Krumholzibacteria bacterium]MDH5268785.1 phosphatase PAP2 family protein [Candidatus Krumholzibacteria bacterium]